MNMRGFSVIVALFGVVAIGVAQRTEWRRHELPEIGLSVELPAAPRPGTVTIEPGMQDAFRGAHRAEVTWGPQRIVLTSWTVAQPSRQMHLAAWEQASVRHYQGTGFSDFGLAGATDARIDGVPARVLVTTYRQGGREIARQEALFAAGDRVFRIESFDLPGRADGNETFRRVLASVRLSNDLRRQEAERVQAMTTWTRQPIGETGLSLETTGAMRFEPKTGGGDSAETYTAGSGTLAALVEVRRFARGQRASLDRSVENTLAAVRSMDGVTDFTPNDTRNVRVGRRNARLVEATYRLGGQERMYRALLIADGGRFWGVVTDFEASDATARAAADRMLSTVEVR